MSAVACEHSVEESVRQYGDDYETYICVRCARKRTVPSAEDRAFLRGFTHAAGIVGLAPLSLRPDSVLKMVADRLRDHEEFHTRASRIENLGAALGYLSGFGA